MAATVSLADFRAAFPELSGYADAVVTDALGAAAQIDARTARVILNLAAHVLESNATDPVGEVGGAGYVTSMKAGNVSVSMPAAAMGTDSLYAMTRYGRMYLLLRDTLDSVYGGFVVT